eukprot:gene1260-1172_t
MMNRDIAEPPVPDREDFGIQYLTAMPSPLSGQTGFTFSEYNIFRSDAESLMMILDEVFGDDGLMVRVLNGQQFGQMGAGTGNLDSLNYVNVGSQIYFEWGDGTPPTYSRKEDVGTQGLKDQIEELRVMAGRSPPKRKISRLTWTIEAYGQGTDMVRIGFKIGSGPSPDNLEWVSDLTSRPFVLNRDVESGTDERKVLVNSTEYDGMVENPYVLALNRISAFNAIREWDRDEDYFIDNEYSMSFLIEYQKKMGGKMIPTTARWELEEGRGTLTDYQHLESALRSEQ